MRHTATICWDDYNGHLWNLEVEGVISLGSPAYRTKHGWHAPEGPEIESIDWDGIKIVSVVDNVLCPKQGIELDIDAHRHDVQMALRELMQGVTNQAEIEEAFITDYFQSALVAP